MPGIEEGNPKTGNPPSDVISKSEQGIPGCSPLAGGDWRSGKRCTAANMAGSDSGMDALFDPPKSIQDGAHVSSFEQYQAMHQRSIDDPAGFWGEIAEQFYWKVPPTKEKFFEYNFDASKGPISIKWMQGAVTNVSYNVLDRHVDNGLGDKIAFHWWVGLIFHVLGVWQFDSRLLLS